MISLSHQAVVYYYKNRDKDHDPILPKAKFSKGQTVGTAISEKFIAAVALSLAVLISLYLNINDAKSSLFSAPSFL